MSAVASPEDTTEPGAVATALRETGSAIRKVFAHPALRRIQLALAGSMIGDWAYATAVTVWVFGEGGAKAVGLWYAIRLAVMAFASPIAATFADKFPRKQVMIASDVIRVAFVVGAAICIAAKTPAAPVYILATLTSLVGCAFRPAQRAIMPNLADSPEQLAASNGVSSTIESLAVFVGPTIGATLVAATNVQTVFYINAATFALSAALVLRIKAAAAPAPEPGAGDDEPEEGAFAAIFAGFKEIKRSRDLSVVALLTTLQTLVTGAAAVYAVILVVDYLKVGPRGIGYYDAVTGVTAVIGGFIAIARSARRKVTSDLSVGVLLWSVPALLIASSPGVATLFIAAALTGLGNPLVDVNFATAVQSIAPDRVLGRVFGAIEAMLIGSMALGAAVTPFLVDSLGLRTALTIIGLVVVVPTLLLLPRARSADRRLQPPAETGLLRGLPAFALLGEPRLEALARRLERIEVAAGSVIVREGEVGYRFYIIESGRVTVTHGADVIREQDAGEYFGEIALLRDVPRTATVTAADDTVLLVLDRADFLDAVGGHGETAAALDDVVTYRMRF